MEMLRRVVTIFPIFCVATLVVKVKSMRNAVFFFSFLFAFSRVTFCIAIKDSRIAHCMTSFRSRQRTAEVTFSIFLSVKEVG